MEKEKQKRRIRELARQVAEIAADPIQDERRNLWRKHNSFGNTRPLIYIRAFAWEEEVRPTLDWVCTDPVYAFLENQLQMAIFRSAFGDDFVIENFIRLPAVMEYPGDVSRRWGPSILEVRDDVSGAHIPAPSILALEDLDRLVVPRHAVDETGTAQRYDQAADALDGILPVVVDRFPVYTNFLADISTDLAQLRGLEQIMIDMYENPELLHSLAAFMSKGILKVQKEAEAAGDIAAIHSSNQAIAYSEELPDPVFEPGSEGVYPGKPESKQRHELWGFLAAQEFALISPEMHDEFLLQYQLPIMARFGLVAYGCCEDLTRKIDMLRKIPNLRRIAVSPWADTRRCAEQIGTDYIASWRPSPADHVSRGLDEAFVKHSVAEADQIFRDNHCQYDITLKDVHTLKGDIQAVAQWTRTVRDALGM